MIETPVVNTLQKNKLLIIKYVSFLRAMIEPLIHSKGTR